MTTPQTLPGFVGEFRAGERSFGNWYVVDADGLQLVGNLTEEQAESLARVLNAHAPLVEACKCSAASLLGVIAAMEMPSGGALHTRVGILREALSLAEGGEVGK